MGDPENTAILRAGVFQDALEGVRGELDELVKRAIEMGEREQDEQALLYVVGGLVGLSSGIGQILKDAPDYPA